jgi:uncharacterized damage-inducible protein DinB
MTKEAAIQNAPAYYHTYIQLASDEDLIAQLEGGGIDLFIDELDALEELGDHVYEEGKWTVKEIVQHLIDTERIFAYRVLRFMRQDATELAGFDENEYARKADVSKRKLSSLLEEYQIVRLSNCYLFNQLSEEEFNYVGTANGNQISIGAIAFVMIGHAIHHFNVIQERYLGAEKVSK